MTNSNAMNHFQRGLQKLKQGDFFGAISDFSEAISIDPNYTEAYLERAQAKIATNELSQILDAYSDYDKAVKLEPNNAKALAGRGMLSIQLSPEDQRGLDDLQRAASINTDDDIYWNIGIAKLQNGDYKGMYEAFEKCVEYKTRNNRPTGDGLYFMGVALQNMHNWESAIEYFSSAINNKLEYNYEYAFYNRAAAYCQLKKYDEALKDYEKVLKIKPNFIDAYIAISQILYSRKNISEALQTLYTALKYDNENVKLFEELTSQLLLNKEYRLAIEYCSRLIQIEPQVAHHFQNRGVCFLGLAEYKQALYDLDRAIEINPSMAYAYYYRGICYHYLGSNQACDDWKSALKYGCQEAKTWIDDYCHSEEDRRVQIGPGLWISLDSIEAK